MTLKSENCVDTVIPVILSGGAGTRLWPLSRQSLPKPFIRLQNGKSLIGATFSRAAAIPGVCDILSVTNQEYHLQTAEELTASVSRNNIQVHYLLEPFGRNTAAAIALASQFALEKFGADCKLLVLPADHIIDDQNAFIEAVSLAVAAANLDVIATFGVKPTSPDTNFGYIERTNPDKKNPSFYQVRRFHEKPAREVAESYFQDDNFFWNAGIFCFKPNVLLNEIKLQDTEFHQNIIDCWHATNNTSSPVYFKKDDFLKLKPISIDYAVMENAKNIAMVEANFKWNDVGTWGALNPLLLQEMNGNYTSGEAISYESDNCHIHSQTRLVATVGVNNLTIVDTQDALLVASNDQLHNVPEIVSRLVATQHKAYFDNRTMCRPWGAYTVLEEGEQFKIKRLLVRPGGSLSLQMHHHRNEHWVIVSGTAEVVIGTEKRLVHTNQSIYIPAGIQHRLGNTGKIDLILIEVQTGQYLGEDDIVRFEDSYGRV